MGSTINPHNVGAVVQRGKDVEVRYLDGKKSVTIKSSTTSKVMKEIENLKRQSGADGDG